MIYVIGRVVGAISCRISAKKICQDLTYAQSVELPDFLLADNGVTDGYLRKL